MGITIFEDPQGWLNISIPKVQTLCELSRLLDSVPNYRVYNMGMATDSEPDTNLTIGKCPILESLESRE